MAVDIDDYEFSPVEQAAAQANAAQAIAQLKKQTTAAFRNNYRPGNNSPKLPGTPLGYGIKETADGVKVAVAYYPREKAPNGVFHQGLSGEEVEVEISKSPQELVNLPIGKED